MISKGHITAWRDNVPWTSDAQIEQDLVISRALVELFSDNEIQKTLAFRGGTALHKLFLQPPGRYSEDIDLVQIKATPIGEILGRVRSILDPWLGKAKYKANQGRATFYYKFDSEIAPVTPLRLKVEINTREHFSVLGYTKQLFSVENAWFSGSADITSYKIEELLGTKMRALYQRKKGRDLFDLYESLQTIKNIKPEDIVKCFEHYMKHDEQKVSRAQFEENLAEKIDDQAFTSDMPPLLAGEKTFDIHQAYETVLTSLISKLPGDPWKGKKK